MSRQSHYETRIRHLLNEIRNKDSEIERLTAALRASTEQVIDLLLLLAIFNICNNSKKLSCCCDCRSYCVRRMV